MKFFNISFSQNGLTQLPDSAFDGLPNLEKVDLSDNIISSIGRFAFKDLHKLEYIHLQGNKLYHLQHDWIFGEKFFPLSAHIKIILAVSYLDNIAAIFMDENEINCDCNLKEFKNDFTDRNSRVFRVLQPDELKCSFPRSESGKKLTEVDLSKTVCIGTSLEPPPPPPPRHGFIGFFIGIILTGLIFFLYPKYKRYRVTQNFPSRPQG